jgi:benzodiazapine receptor
MNETSLSSGKHGKAKFVLSPFWKLVVAILICEATGLVSGLLSRSELSSWYQTLNKPTWNPPSWLFGPVWTLLYLLMAVSLWLIWKSNASETAKHRSMWIFALQLFLNFWWSILFFNLHSPGLAFLDIILMLTMIAITLFHFAKISQPAAYLLTPYLAWVSFATILNYTLWVMNPN